MKFFVLMPFLLFAQWDCLKAQKLPCNMSSIEQAKANGFCHPSGGYVQDTATVGPWALIDLSSAVCGNSVVKCKAELAPNVQIYDSVVIESFTFVPPRTILRGSQTITPLDFPESIVPFTPFLAEIDHTQLFFHLVLTAF